MAFAAGCGLDIAAASDALADLFAEEVGVVVGVDAVWQDEVAAGGRAGPASAAAAWRCRAPTSAW